MSNTSTPITDPRAQRWGSFVKWIVLIIGFAIFAPVIWLAVGGLFGFILFAAVLLGTWILKEPAYTWAANMRLKLIKAEVAKNPVETLQAEHLRQSTILEDRKKGLESMSGAIRTLKQAINNLEAEFPDSPELPQMREDYTELVRLEKARQEDWQMAFVSLGEFAKEIRRVGKLWEVSLAAARARQQSGLTEDEWLSKMKTETSIDTIRTSLNTQLAALSTERMQADANRILKGRAAAQATPSKK
jgi:hypothetical protein